MAMQIEDLYEQLENMLNILGEQKDAVGVITFVKAEDGTIGLTVMDADEEAGFELWVQPQRAGIVPIGG